MEIKINYFIGGLFFLALFIIVDIILSRFAIASGSFRNGFLLRESLKIGLAIVSIIFFFLSAFKDKKLAIRIISICLIILLSYWLIDKVIFIHKTSLLRNQNSTNSAESFVPDETHSVTPVMAFVGKFMEARLERNQPLAESFLTDNAKKQYSQPGLTLIGTSNPHFINRDLLGCQKKSVDKYLCKVRIYEEYAKGGSAGYFDEDLILKKFGNKYLVDEVKREKYQTIKKSVEDDNFEKYSNPLLGIEFNYPKNFIPYLRDHEYLVGRPSRFTSGKDSYAPLDGSSYFVIDLGSSGRSIDQHARDEAYHKLQPFGKSPLIKKLKIEGQEARLIIPSDPSNNETELIVKLKTPVLVSGNYWPFLMISVHKDLNRKTVKIISKSLHSIK